MTKEEEMQQKIVLYQLLHKHLEELKQQSVMLEQRFMEFEATKQALGDFKGVNDSELLVPLGSGCYAKSKAVASSELLVNIGANLMVKKPISDTVKLLEERTKEIQELSKGLQEQVDAVISQITAIAGDIENMQHQH